MQPENISVDPSMFYHWKEIYDTYGVDGLISGTRHSDPSARKLKKMLAEKVYRIQISISRFIELYNYERLHSAIDHKAPRKVHEQWKESIIEK